MLTTYFKSKQLDIFILFCLKIGKGTQNDIILDKIKFFWKEPDVLLYIEKNNLELLNQKLLDEQGVVSDLINVIKEYLSGKKINLYDSIKNINIDLSFKEKFHTDFSRKVMRFVTQLKYGEITSYSDIGQEINSKAYRAIGTVLKKNPIPLIIPCHRVLGKNGIGGFMGKTKGGAEINLKRDLLEIEGVLEYEKVPLQK